MEVRYELEKAKARRDNWCSTSLHVRKKDYLDQVK